MNRPRTIFVTVAALAAVAACAEAPDRAAADPEPDLRGTVLQPSWPKPDFTLVDTRGEPFAFRAETDGFVTLLFFGYTHCPDVCPIHMANIAAVLDDLKYADRERIRVVFVTTDPDRDTPERLRDWLDRFDPSFVGLRGSGAEVDAIQAELHLPGAIRQPAPPGPLPGEYAMGHAAQVIAFTADGRARVLYPFGTRQADWAHDLPRLVHGGPWSDPPTGTSPGG